MSNQKLLSKIKNEEYRNFWTKFVKAIEAKGFEVILTDTQRTYQEQAALHAANPKNAKAGTSKHETGRAIDLNIKKDGVQYFKKDSALKWLTTGVPQMAKEMGLKWGGDAFQTYHDPVHFEFSNSAWETVKSFFDTVKEKTGSGLPLIALSIILLILIFITNT